MSASRTNLPTPVPAQQDENGTAARALLQLPLVSLREVTKRWDRKRPPVLDGVDLALDAGRLVALSGGNGVGKTTLLRILAGLIFPDRGTVRVDGLHPVRDRRNYQRRIGFVSAGYGGLYARFSAANHLDLWARLAFIPASERRGLCERAIARFELQEFATRRVDRLSMGQRQRVRLALAFLHEPKLVLLDEPWNSLDEPGIEILTRALLEARAGGATAICCSPTGDEILAHADDRYVVADGGIRPR
jgi:ABC-type multidrug transport system ATPase subunit